MRTGQTKEPPFRPGSASGSRRCINPSVNRQPRWCWGQNPSEARAFGWRRSFLIAPVPGFAAAFILIGFWLGMGNGKTLAAPPRVVVYASQDQVYAEPILQKFEKQSGIQIATIFDSEAVKTVGLANRLLGERSHPQCDLFWSNEELRTRQLAAQHVFRADQPWTAVGFRSRRIVVNTNSLAIAKAPRNLSDLTNRIWRSKVALAYPLFGTTATHFLALRQRWGHERWEGWCRGLAENKPFLVDGNSVAAKLVARGEAWIGLTDSDDILAEQHEGAPIAPLPIDEESLLIPNTIAVISNSAHPDAAQQLWEYLQTPEVTRQLIVDGALEGLTADAVFIKTLQPDWDRLLKDLGTATDTLQKIFLR